MQYMPFWPILENNSWELLQGSRRIFTLPEHWKSHAFLVLDSPISCLPHTDTICSSCFSSSSGRRGHRSRLFGCLALCHPSVSALFISEERGHLGFLSPAPHPGQAGHVAKVWAENPEWWLHTMGCRSPLQFSSSTAMLCTTGMTGQEINFCIPHFFQVSFVLTGFKSDSSTSIFLDLAPFLSCNSHVEMFYLILQRWKFLRAWLRGCRGENKCRRVPNPHLRKKKKLREHLWVLAQSTHFTIAKNCVRIGFRMLLFWRVFVLFWEMLISLPRLWQRAS